MAILRLSFILRLILKSIGTTKYIKHKILDGVSFISTVLMKKSQF